jgi:predicted ABC-type ATPase
MIDTLQPPRLRIFAGPNGSGKSTIKLLLAPKIIGFYINPDEIEKEIRTSDFVDFDQFDMSIDKREIFAFLENSTLLEKTDLMLGINDLRFNDNKLSFSNVHVNAYWASVVADFIRQKLLAAHQSFTFETVMSSKDKVELLKKAQQLGYRTYLYYVATEDPAINVSRVNQRVSQGGHHVPQNKIIERYYRSLDLLREAIKYSHRAYIFDNSGNHQLWLAEITDAKTIEIKSDSVPNWFNRYILEKQ